MLPLHTDVKCDKSIKDFLTLNTSLKQLTHTVTSKLHVTVPLYLLKYIVMLLFNKKKIVHIRALMKFSFYKYALSVYCEF